MGLYDVKNPLTGKRMDHCTDDEIKSFIFDAFKKMGVNLPDCAIEYVDRELPVCVCCPKCHEVTGVFRRSTITTDQSVVFRSRDKSLQPVLGHLRNGARGAGKTQQAVCVRSMR